MIPSLFITLTFALLAAANTYASRPSATHPHHEQLALHPRGLLLSVPSDSGYSEWEREQVLGLNKQRLPSRPPPIRSARRARRPGIVSPPRFPPPEFVGPGPDEVDSPGRGHLPLSTPGASPWGSPIRHGYGHGHGHGRAAGRGSSTPRSASPKSDRMSWGDTGQESIPSWSTPGWLKPKEQERGDMAGAGGASGSGGGDRSEVARQRQDKKKKGGWAGRIKGCFAGGSGKSQCSQ